MVSLSRLPITSRLSFRLFLILFLSIVIVFIGYTAITSEFQRGVLEGQVKADASRLADVIKQSLLTTMLANDRAGTSASIRFIGDEPGVEVVRIYNKEGEVSFSSQEEDIGRAVDMEAEACYVCHASDQPLGAVPTEERARIYQRGGGYRVLGLITPIHNRESCWNAGCHAHTRDQTVLGVLDVQMTMQQADIALTSARRHALLLAIGVLLLASLLMAAIVYRAVHVPTRALHAGTQRLAKGKLDARIELDRADELGALARSFNEMAASLEEADEELRAWSHTLEDRVRQKTEELEAFHQQMMQVEKAASLGKMAATVAHELNNPLSGILTYAKLVDKRVDRLVEDGDEKQRIKANLNLVASESARCGRIVRDLLTFARQNTTEFQRAQLHELIDRSLSLVAHHFELGGIETETKYELEDDSIVCDPEQIVQLLVALLINAVEAMPDGGKITVTTRKSQKHPDRGVTLSVADTGVGIPESIRDKIFDPFFSTKNEAKGVGLGLAVVYGIVQRHEGDVSVVSWVGKGTTFEMELPRDPDDAARERIG